MANSHFFQKTRRARRQTSRRFEPLALLLALCVLVVLAYYSDVLDSGPTPAATPLQLTGIARVIDGDTLEVRSQRIRLDGIDAPESGQLCRDGRGRHYDCGAAATQALRAFLPGNSEIECKISGRDHYDRLIGDCYRAEGTSVSAWLVNQGHALDWPRYSQGAYAQEQEEAEREQRGLWAGSFDKPWDWRAGRRSEASLPDGSKSGLVAAAIQEPANEECRIKGNINASGERIYHMPGQHFYERTRISPEQGERWFCSQIEASEAGWRPARR